jgi:hypothetical protein
VQRTPFPGSGESAIAIRQLGSCQRIEERDREHFIDLR